VKPYEYFKEKLPSGMCPYLAKRNIKYFKDLMSDIEYEEILTLINFKIHQDVFKKEDLPENF